MGTKEHVRSYEGRWYAYPPLRNALIAGLVAGITFLLAHIDRLIPLSIEMFLYTLAILLGGYHWGREGIEKLIEEKAIGIEMLMMGAALGSAVLGMWDEAAFLAFLYGTAEGIEEYTFAKTRSSIRGLLNLAPKEACVLRDGGEVVVAAKDLKVGDVFVVRPGESIPTDGIVERGVSSVDEAPVTGESIPVEKREGMKVLAGTINKEGSLQIRATAAFEDNTLSRIIHLIEEAQEKKGKAQMFIERFGRKYSPLVFLSSLILMVVPPIIVGDFTQWALRAVVLLVAAAPCALVMSTPVAIAAGIGLAGRHGVLIKGGMYLEDLAKIKAVAFDKTGTLTKGKPVVTDVIPIVGTGQSLLALASSVERLSEHPIARAIVEKAMEYGVSTLTVEGFEAIPGAGAKAYVNGTPLYVGSPPLFRKLGFRFKEHSEMIDGLTEEGKTIVLVGLGESIAGIIALRDEIRPEAKAIIRDLHDMGIKVTMFTGDNRTTARAIAEELGIDEYEADLTPEGKIEAIRKLGMRYGACAMVGDGINDAPALAHATVGIAMGTAGADAAIEAADIALMADDLTKVSYALRLGKKAMAVSNQNVVFSLVVLAVLIPSALIGALTVAPAVFIHETSELLAVLNGLRVGWER
jgi:Cd2+/Zn2+-exporting ATPase